ncbi:MAG: SUMF1/EgtB/PvdO family nonheme iron enzyme, partial [Candidatus Competibacteraceae bacterium]|nr:SUMF1/EgtB/PvdO family nonheme iron enzyme [Candidatus Competibacteraceae bacterium]
GGIPENKYPWGAKWEEGRANTDESGLGRTTAVGMYPGGASRQGVMDMVGNIREWCFNKSEKPRETELFEAPRVVRGGSWYGNALDARAAARFDFGPGSRLDRLGFRVCRSFPT